MTETAEIPPKQRSFALLLLGSFALFNGAYILDQTVRWSDHWDGFWCGLVHVVFRFETTPQEVDRLIADMKLAEDVSGSLEMLPKLGFPQPPGWPDDLSWEGARWFKGHEASVHWFYNLVTDSARTRVYVWVGCT